MSGIVVQATAHPGQGQTGGGQERGVVGEDTGDQPSHDEPREWVRHQSSDPIGGQDQPDQIARQPKLDTQDGEDRKDDAAADPADEREQRQHPGCAADGAWRIERSGAVIRHAREGKPPGTDT